jgi:hypothetical protein
VLSRRVSPELLELRIPYRTCDDTQEFLLLSDVHLDNPLCDRRLLKRHLDQARERDARVLVFGDLLCLMQGKKDRRGSKSSIRPEHLGGNYFDLVFRECAEWLQPWADLIVMISDGNHETAIINHNEIDPLGHLSRLMRDQGSPVEHLRYQGWVWFTFRPEDDRGKTRRMQLFFHHGAWGGIVSKGVMGGGRYFSAAPQAQVVVNGHNHQRTVVSHACYSINAVGHQEISERWHVQTGTYKQEYAGGAGFAVERIVMPASLGGVWMTLRPRRSGGVAVAFTNA